MASASWPGFPIPPPSRRGPAKGRRGRGRSGAPGRARRPGRGLLPGAGRHPEAGASGEGQAGAGTHELRPPPVRRPRAPLLYPAPRIGRRGRGLPGWRRRPAGRGPRSGFRAGTSVGTGRRGRRGADSAPGHRTGTPLTLPLCPGPENPAPSRPFERWILLTYLAALESRVESWVFPDRVGLAFVTLG